MKNSTLIAIAALAACTTTVNAQQLRHTRLHSAAPFAIKANNSAQKTMYLHIQLFVVSDFNKITKNNNKQTH